MRKKSYFILVFLLLLSLQLYGQNAIGLRFGATGAEVSFQTNKLFPNRLELDAGWGWNTNWHNCNFTGIYQWVFPIESGFYWYVGPGAALGFWNYIGKYPDDHRGGVSIAIVLNGGAEYNFSEIPLQVSMDLRLTPYLIHRGNAYWFDLGISARYLF